MNRFGSALLTLGLVLGQGASAFGQVGSAPIGTPRASEQLAYEATRNGDRIGRCVFRIERARDTIRVEASVDLTVRFLSIPVYRWRHHATESWKAGRLLEMIADTDDDGSIRHVEAVTDANNAVRVQAGGREYVGDAGAVPASFWNPAVLDAPTLIDAVKGEFVHPVVRRMENETVGGGALRQEAQHFVLSSDHALKQEMWFGDSELLLQFRAFAPDGSAITYHLISID